MGVIRVSSAIDQLIAKNGKYGETKCDVLIRLLKGRGDGDPPCQACVSKDEVIGSMQKQMSALQVRVDRCPSEPCQVCLDKDKHIKTLRKRLESAPAGDNDHILPMEALKEWIGAKVHDERDSRIQGIYAGVLQKIQGLM